MRRHIISNVHHLMFLGQDTRPKFVSEDLAQPLSNVLYSDVPFAATCRLMNRRRPQPGSYCRGVHFSLRSLAAKHRLLEGFQAIMAFFSSPSGDKTCGLCRDSRPVFKHGSHGSSSTIRHCRRHEWSDAGFLRAQVSEG